ncbi:porin [Massilia niastensis]|uniref:porin n=1 Tax=Massilia niastensis TaxID=544911 RepID=UPI0003A30E48|nr:porin [Massilia niastensis]
MIGNTRTSIAMAAAFACGMPLLAQAAPSVEIYGKLYPQINNARAYGATPAGTRGNTLIGTIASPATENVDGTVMESSNSRLGFRGVEDLGGGLKAFWQLEMGVGVDNGIGGDGTRLFSRDNFVGLSGSAGTIKIGRMDTIYKGIGDALSFLGISSGNFVSNSSVLSKPGIGDSATSFHLRRDNVVQYESPEVGGFQALVQYSLGELASSTRNNSLFGAGITYQGGPFYFALAHERHYDFFGGSRNVERALSNYDRTLRVGLPGTRSTDSATRFTAQYAVTKNTKVEANISRLDYDEEGGAVGRFANYRTDTWSINVQQKLGAFTLQAAYASGDDGECTLVGGAVCSTAGLGGKQLNLGASYSFSKRSMIYLIGSKLENEALGIRTNLGELNDGVVGRGQDIRQVALGVSHTF